MEERSRFAKVLKRARNNRGLSLTEMARRMSVTRGAVARCETGSEPLGERIVERYAAALGFDVELRLVPRGDDRNG